MSKLSSFHFSYKPKIIKKKKKIECRHKKKVGLGYKFNVTTEGVTKRSILSNPSPQLKYIFIIYYIRKCKLYSEAHSMMNTFGG